MRQLVVLILCMALSTVEVWSQTRTVTGRVTDEAGVPIANASVQVRGRGAGTTTNSEGLFSLTVPTGTTRLVVSYVGRPEKEIILTNATDYTVSLDAATDLLEEVVVTGVGTATSRRRVAIAVETVAGKDLPRVPQASIDQALVGRIAGAQITSSSGQPGQQAAILLRGINTLSSTQPMILVDGVQINAGNNANGSASNLSSRLSDLDLSNVERVEVIQGSAAATIYGAQGANGVIQIFTRRGQRNGRTAINVSSRISTDQVLTGNLAYAQNHYYNTDAEGYIVNNSGGRLVRNTRTGIFPLPAAPANLTNAQNNKPFREETFNHLDYLFRTAITSNHSLGISGGGPRSDYAITLSRLDQQSVFTGNYERTNVSLNLGAELFKNFNIRSSTQLVYSENSTGGITGQNNIYSPLGVGLNTRPFADLRVRDSIGNYIVNPVAGENSVNPFYTRQFREFLANTTRILQSVNLNYKPFRVLEIDYKLGIDNYRYDFENYTAYQLNTLTPAQGIDPLTGNRTYDRDNQTFRNSLLTVFLRTDFERDFNLRIPVQSTTQFAYDYRRDNYHNLTTSGTGFAPFPPYNLNGTTPANSEAFTRLITFGYLLNQRFDWGNLFGFSAGVRVDYSSAFGAGSNAFVFPRADAYFRVAELINSRSLTEFKIRGAYGKAGIQPGAYDRLITLLPGNIGTGGFVAARFTAQNPLLNVEVSREIEVGTDIAFRAGSGRSFQNVRISATYWDKASRDVIRAINVSPSTGYGGYLTNAIDLAANGVQASIDADFVNNNNFSWDFGLRFGSSRSIVSRIAGGKDLVTGSSGSGQFALREGESIGTFYGIRPLRDVNEANSKGDRYIPLANVGDYEIVNGMVVNKNTRQVQFTSEQQPIGDPNPDFTMTFLNTFTLFRNFSAFIQLDWIYGNQIYNQTRQWMYRDAIHADFDQPVTINGQTGAWVAYYNSLYNTNRPNEFFVERGSFLRVRDVTLSYRFGDFLNRRFSFFRTAEVTLTGRNLLTFTNYTGLDPEASASLNDPMRRGLDLYNFPNFKTYQLGLNFGF